MRAAIFNEYGGPNVVRVAEVPAPALGPKDVLVEVHASSVTSGDVRIRALNVPQGMGLMARLALGVFGPRRQVLGVEYSGVVLGVGSQVTRFAAGDEVFGINGRTMGCHAELVVVSESSAIALKPKGLSHAQAAALSFGGTTAYDFLKRAKVTSGDRLLVNGASGSVGLAVIQLAKAFGAHVTAVCSAANHALVQSVGADAVIDYQCEDFTTKGPFDVIFDAVGNVTAARVAGCLTPEGRLVLAVAGVSDMLGAPWVNATSSRTVLVGPVSERADDVAALARLVDEGRLKPIIDREYPLEQIAEAHAYVDTQRKRGSVIVAIKGRA